MIALLVALVAAPSWANKPDASDASGRTFVCEGRGKTEAEALGAAHGICNDKICKVCGVEVESIVETKETLSGVDFQRKVIERCRRVRQGEARVERKSSDCEPEGCTAWIQIRFTKEDERRECATYAKEDFADPAACEKDIDLFARVEGRTADSFRRRAALLGAALGHCEKIDVRPTPALLALDNKLAHGMDAFEYPPGPERQFPAAFLTTPAPLRRQISESKLLSERLGLARDYVANRALVFDVIEAAQADDLDTPGGIERLRAALMKAPPGGQYGSPAVHFVALFRLGRAKSDTGPIGAALRRIHPPAAFDPGQLFGLAIYFKGDGKVTAEEWDYVFAVNSSCAPCLRVLLEASDHGGLRAARFFSAWEAQPRKTFAAFKSLVGYQTPDLLLEVEPRLPEDVRAAIDWKFLRELVTRLKQPHPALLARAARALGAGPADRSGCVGLADAIERLAKAGGDPAPVRARACTCLGETLAGETRLVNRSDLEAAAQRHGFGCAP